MDKFVARENIRHFLNRLETESNSEVHDRLLKLLAAELYKLARYDQTHREVDNCIDTVTNWMERQHQALAETEPNGRRATEIEVLLGSYDQVLVALREQRLVIRNELTKPEG